MANRTLSQNLIDTTKRTLLKYYLVSDATATANSSIIKFSELNFALNASGYISNTEPQVHYGMSIKRIYGYNKTQNAGGYVTLKWEDDANTEIVSLASGSFDIDMSGVSGDNAVITSPAANVKGLLISMTAPTSADTLTLFVDMHKDNNDFDAGAGADPAAFNKGTWAL